MQAVIFSCQGLGDGLISLTLSNNLTLNGYKTTTFHNQLIEMQSWFKGLAIEKFPVEDDFFKILDKSDLIFVFYCSREPIQQLIQIGKKFFAYKFYVLNPSFSRNIGKQLFYKDTCFDPKITIVKNIELFCKNILKLKNCFQSNGIIFPSDLLHRKYLNRIVIHPTSANKAKNWFLDKYINLSLHLKKHGFNPIFVMSKQEESLIKNIPCEARYFTDLNDLAHFVYESGYMIGNDSGIGHMASSMQIPTLSIFRNLRAAKLWRPGWGGEIIYPNRFIPNLSIYRLRDKHWQSLISVKKVLQEFLKMQNKNLIRKRIQSHLNGY